MRGRGVKRVGEEIKRDEASRGVRGGRQDTAFAKGLRDLAENLIKGKKRKYRITEACLSSFHPKTFQHLALFQQLLKQGRKLKRRLS